MVRIGGMGRHGGGGMGEPAKPKNPFRSLRRVIPWIAPYWPVMLFGFGCMIINTYLGLQPPRIIKYTIDVLTEKSNTDSFIPALVTHFRHALDSAFGDVRYDLIWAVVLLYLGVHFSTNLFGFLRTFYLHVGGQRMLHDLRVRLYGHFQRLPLTYYDNKQTGDLMSRMTGDVQEIEHLMVHGLDVFIMGVLGMGIAFSYMWSYHHTLALLILIPVPVLAISIFFFSRAVRSIYRGIRDAVGNLNAKIQDNLSGIRVIKAFGREPIEMSQVTVQSHEVAEKNIRGIRMWSSFGPAMGFVGNIGLVVVLGAGMMYVLKGEMTVGTLTACLAFVGSFYGPIGQLFQVFDSLQRSLAAGERILEVLDTVPEIRDPENPLPLEDVRGEVEFRNVSFRYATGEIVLRDVSVRAHPGQRIALVGRSGAGKTSFVNLIPRFYDTLEGSVVVEGRDVRDVRQEDLRKHIALVLQETFLFNGTVKENLRYGKLDATDAELEEAATVANAHEFIVRLPNGYDTEIGERGVKLSGGQKQRLAIARAVLANPRILILDEATSSVDSESEFLIHQALERLMEGRTTFIIAHRLSTIKHADVILVLEGGSVIERGDHEELLQADGLYAQMYRQQFWLDELNEEMEEEEHPVPSLDNSFRPVES